MDNIAQTILEAHIMLASSYNEMQTVSPEIVCNALLQAKKILKEIFKGRDVISLQLKVRALEAVDASLSSIRPSSILASRNFKTENETSTVQLVEELQCMISEANPTIMSLEGVVDEMNYLPDRRDCNNVKISCSYRNIKVCLDELRDLFYRAQGKRVKAGEKVTL